MDRRSWLWRRKSSEKSPGETESSGSVSSHSERFSDDQEASRASPNHTQSPEVSSNHAGDERHDTVKSLTEKLSAALSNISAKEDLVKQHAKVAEEAVSGWEKAENEVAALKQKLETAAQKNAALEDRAGHLDGALKECVRQLRQAREEQEQRIRDAVIKKTQEWESTKFKLESKLSELQTQLEASEAEAAAAASFDHELQSKLEAVQKENSALKLELLARAEELEVRTLERELSTQAAETASKQHLESIKKVAKLEAECRRLRAVSRKASPGNDHKLMSVSSIYVESLTDSQSDSGERMLAVESDIRKMGSVESNECEQSCSDSWATALIAELDQFKNEKAVGRNLTSVSISIDLMDDFLEMERLAALHETDNGSRGSDVGPVVDQPSTQNSSLKAELESTLQKNMELEEKLQKLEGEKVELSTALIEMQDQLEISKSQLSQAEQKLAEVERQLALAFESKQAAEAEVEAANAKSKEADSQLEALNAEVQMLHVKIGSLEAIIEEERILSAEISAKCQNLKEELSSKKREAEVQRAMTLNGDFKIKQEKELAVAAGKLAECQKTIASLGQQLKSLATLEDFLLDPDMPDLNGGTPVHRGELQRSQSLDTPISKNEANSSKNNDGSSASPIGVDVESTLSSSSSSSVNHGPEKSRNAFGKLFSRSKNNSSHIENH